MQLKLKLISKTPSQPEGTFNLGFVAADDNAELALPGEAPNASLSLNSVPAAACADLSVPSEEERTGMKVDEEFGNPKQGHRVPTNKPLVPYQEFVIELKPA